jgi:ATP-dependent RNA helicase MSS116
MDFPGVTHVIQMGLATDRDTYIHRIGRTARAGREGTGWLFVSELEAPEISFKLGKLPLQANESITSAKLDLSKAADIPASTGRILSMYQAAIQQVPRVEKVKAFMAMFGTFGWFNRKQQLVDNMNALAQFGWGMPEPPSMSAKLIQKLPGMRHVTGIRIGRDPEDEDDQHRSGGGRGGGGGGFGKPSFGRHAGPAGNFDKIGPNYGRSSRGSFGGSRGDRGGHGDDFGGRGRSFGRSEYGGDREGGRERRAYN